MVSARKVKSCKSSRTTICYSRKIKPGTRRQRHKRSTRRVRKSRRSRIITKTRRRRTTKKKTTRSKRRSRRRTTNTRRRRRRVTFRGVSRSRKRSRKVYTSPPADVLKLSLSPIKSSKSFLSKASKTLVGKGSKALKSITSSVQSTINTVTNTLVELVTVDDKFATLVKSIKSGNPKKSMKFMKKLLFWLLAIIALLLLLYKTTSLGNKIEESLESTKTKIQTLWSNIREKGRLPTINDLRSLWVSLTNPIWNAAALISTAVLGQHAKQKIIDALTTARDGLANSPLLAKSMLLGLSDMMGTKAKALLSRLSLDKLKDALNNLISLLKGERPDPFYLEHGLEEQPEMLTEDLGPLLSPPLSRSSRPSLVDVPPLDLGGGYSPVQVPQHLKEHPIRQPPPITKEIPINVKTSNSTTKLEVSRLSGDQIVNYIQNKIKELNSKITINRNLMVGAVPSLMSDLIKENGQYNDQIAFLETLQTPSLSNNQKLERLKNYFS